MKTRTERTTDGRLLRLPSEGFPPTTADRVLRLSLDTADMTALVRGEHVVKVSPEGTTIIHLAWLEFAD